MRRFGNGRIILLLVSLTITAIAAPAGAQVPPDKVLDLFSTVSGVPKMEPINPDNIWMEIYPDESLSFYQVAYDKQNHDSPDMHVDDYLRLSVDPILDEDDNWYRIDWLGPTYHLLCDDGMLHIYEPTDLGSLEGDPTGQQWLRVYPTFGDVVDVIGWESGDALLNEWDTITIEWDTVPLETATCQLAKIGVGVNVEFDEDPIRIEHRTWGDVKGIFR